MKEETIEKIEDEIKRKTNMPENKKEKVRKEIFANILLAIGIIVYFIFLVLGSLDTEKITRSIDLKIFSMVLLFTSIILFELAYKKDSGRLAINGIEVLIVAVITLFLPYIVFELDSIYQRYYIAGSSLIAVYYAIKSIIISNKAKKSYEKQESDIKEITKKDNKKENILEEEIEDIAENNIKEEKEQEKEIKKTIDKNKEKVEIKKSKKKSKKQNKNNVGAGVLDDSKQNTTPKKRGRPKKSTIEETKKEENRKSKKPKKQNKNNVEVGVPENPKQNNAPKKRGRPRKVVSK